MVKTDTYRLAASTLGEIPVVRLEGVERFDVAKTFDCGQCFRFEPVKGSRHEAEYAGVAHGRLISFAQDGDTLYIYNSTERDFYELWRRYLGLDIDYAAIDADILSRSDNPALCEAVRVGSGIRILRQAEWETVCSFIISQNNNIPRIKKIISSMSECYGKRISASGMEAHVGEASGAIYSFPTPESLCAAGVDGLLALRTGFRAKYIYDAARVWSLGEIDVAALAGESQIGVSVSDCVTEPPSTADAVRLLESIKGVGPKVAACSLLFGFGRLNAFPVDVWIKRVIARYFGEGFTASSLGPYAGVAQQYLFYYERYLGGDGRA